jgi:DNA polymerase-1
MSGKQSNADRRPTLFLVDGSAVVYRAYFAFIRNPLINSKGENTSASFGFVNSLVKIIREEKPDYLAVAFDTKAPTFRHEMYPEYKATRVKMPDDLVAQLPRIHEAVEALNVAKYALEGYEADDVIATVASRAAEQGLDVFIVSSDKDLFQLVNDRIRIYLPQRGSEPPIKLDREGVKGKLGVYPEQVIEFLSLAGDSSDNIPGIPGVGPKTALTLLAEFGSLDSILENSASIAAKGVRAKVSDHKDMALLSRRLVTIDRHVPVAFDFPDIARKEPDLQKCKQLFAQLEFFNLLKELAGESEAPQATSATAKATYVRVTSMEELKALVTRLSRVREFAFDTETDSLNPLSARLVGIALAAKAGEAYYIPIGHTSRPEFNLPADQVLELLGPLMSDKNVQKIAQNFKFDLQIMENAGYTVDPVSFDTMLASYILNPSARGHNLDFLALEHFDHRMIPITDLIGTGKKQVSFATVDPDTAAGYAAEDADYTYRLRGVFAPKLEEKKLARLYYDIELPLIPVLARMERVGVKIDAVFLKKLSVDMEKEMDKTTGAIYALAGYEFNINSTQQLAKVLFEELRLPTGRKTAKKTAYSTDVRVLEELSRIHPLPRAVLEHRQLSKLKSTYVDALPELIDPATGRVHTSFNQTITATGRLSSSDPNLQNIPIRTDSGREIRKAFIPSDDHHLLLVADYSQIELRILAHYSDDQGLIAAFRNGEDIHARTAAEVFGVPIDQVTPPQRRAAKTANFAIIYGVSAYGLSQQTELNLTASKDFIDTYFSRYPGIKGYIDGIIATARRDGYVTTLLGRRRYLPEIDSKNFQIRQFAERTAINTPIQGTAADLIKIAMIVIDRRLRSMRSTMVLQVHDELVFDAHQDEMDELRKLVTTEMSRAIKLKVPLVVDVGVGPNWLEAK